MIANRESSQKIEELTENLLLLPHYEPMTARIGMPTNCYALVCGAQIILVDAVFADVLPLVEALADAGNKIAALVLSHRHLVPQAEVLPEIVSRFEVPVFLHPLDAAHPQARRWRDLQYADPMSSKLFIDCGIEVKHFPGHTEGSVILLQNNGATVIAGDSAMGATIGKAATGGGTMTRPPVSFNVNDNEMRRNWTTFDLPATIIAPYHGLSVVNDLEEITKALRSLRKSEPTFDLGDK